MVHHLCRNIKDGIRFEKCHNTEFFLVRISPLGLDAERYSVSLHIQSEHRKIRTRKNFVFGHFSRSHIVVKKSNCSKKKDTHAILIEMILISIIIIIILLCRFIAFARQCLMPTYSSWASYT